MLAKQQSHHRWQNRRHFDLQSFCCRLFDPYTYSYGNGHYKFGTIFGWTPMSTDEIATKYCWRRKFD